MFNLNSKIILCGGAGLVGQNLVHILINNGYSNITVIDKNKSNLSILKNLHPKIVDINADLSKEGEWEISFKGANIVVMLQAQIGGKDYADFQANSLNSTRNILENYKKYKLERLIHISSSVVNSLAEDFYSQTKKQQELLVHDSGISCPILRPTLMFGWFDRKHLGWLSRFMTKVPIFPIPGKGKYIRQPLYVQDFCNIIISCMKNINLNETYDISGLEKIYYIDIIFHIKKAIQSNTIIVKIPYKLFYWLIKVWSIFDKEPPFTTQQLEALVTKEEFEIIDWPQIFGVQNTPYDEAISKTFCDTTYSNIKLDF
jgi:nucleoside-diphosphate-sugar epimerase